MRLMPSAFAFACARNDALWPSADAFARIIHLRIAATQNSNSKGQESHGQKPRSN